jgi:hypothetical protein
MRPSPPLGPYPQLRLCDHVGSAPSNISTARTSRIMIMAISLSRIPSATVAHRQRTACTQEDTRADARFRRKRRGESASSRRWSASRARARERLHGSVQEERIHRGPRRCASDQTVVIRKKAIQADFPRKCGAPANGVSRHPHRRLTIGGFVSGSTPAIRRTYLSREEVRSRDERRFHPWLGTTRLPPSTTA